MSAIIVFDSIFGNTAEVARAIGDELRTSGEVRLVEVKDANAADIAGADLVVLGSPTRGFRPTPAMQEFVGSIGDQLLGISAAVFDTRIDANEVKPKPLGWLMNIGGYAADVLKARLAEKGARTTGEIGAFIVDGTEGPLRDGEIDRARAWAREVAASIGGGAGDAAH